MERDITMAATRAWGKEKEPLGFSLWETWGDWLEWDEDDPRYIAAEQFARKVLTGVRIMVKRQEFEDPNSLMPTKVLNRVLRARELGLEIHLVIDWWNRASGPNDYHAKPYLPKSLAAWKDEVRAIVEYYSTDKEFPEVLEVVNEPYYKKGDKNWLKTADYAEYVYAFARGAKQAGWDGLLLATGTQNGNNVAKGWEWHIHNVHSRCAEGQHMVLRTPDTPEELRRALHPPDYPRRYRVGWRWGIFMSEFSPVARHTNINSAKGAELTRTACDVAKERRFPITILTMGGTPFTLRGGWNMVTGMVNDKGEFSSGAHEFARAVGAKLEDGAVPPIPGPPPPPDPGGGNILSDRKVKSFIRLWRECDRTKVQDVSMAARDADLRKWLRRFLK